MATRGKFVTQVEMDALADLANAKLLPLVNSNISSDGSKPLDTDFVFNSFGLYYTAGANRYDIPADNTDDVRFNANPQPPYKFAPYDKFDTTTKNWCSELNRIRGDYWNLIFTGGLIGTGASSRYLNPDNIVSGPWVVGVNDPDTFPMEFVTSTFNPYDPYYPVVSYQGTLQGRIYDTFTPFKSVCFYYSAADALGGVTVKSGRLQEHCEGTGGGGAQGFTMPYEAVGVGGGLGMHAVVGI